MQCTQEINPKDSILMPIFYCLSYIEFLLYLGNRLKSQTEQLSGHSNFRPVGGFRGRRCSSELLRRCSSFGSSSRTSDNFRSSVPGPLPRRSSSSSGTVVIVAGGKSCEVLAINVLKCNQKNVVLIHIQLILWMELQTQIQLPVAQEQLFYFEHLNSIRGNMDSLVWLLRNTLYN